MVTETVFGYSPEAVTAAWTVVLTLATFGLGIVTGLLVWQTIKARKDAAVPLVVGGSTSEQRPFNYVMFLGSRITLKARNIGVGPALNVSVTARVDGNVYEAFASAIPVGEVVSLDAYPNEPVVEGHSPTELEVTMRYQDSFCGWFETKSKMESHGKGDRLRVRWITTRLERP